MSYYELSFLTSNLPPEEKASLTKKIEERIKKLGGNIKEKFIEKKRFAYPVKKQTEGFLGIFLFSLDTTLISELKNMLDKEEKILRIMLERKKQKPEKKERLRSEKPKITQTKKEKKKKVKIEKLDEKLKEILH